MPQLSREKPWWEKGRLGVQTILGLISLGAEALSSSNSRKPTFCCSDFLVAVLLVPWELIFSSMVITVFLQILKKNKGYYYQPQHDLPPHFPYEENAAGLATRLLFSQPWSDTYVCCNKYL